MKVWIAGGLAGSALLIIYFSILSLISGFSYAIFQFRLYWYFVLALAGGFGIQVGLFTYIKSRVASGMLGVTGATSTISMLSCCSHYLVNILPVIGTTGIISIVSGYQVQIFWLGILANLIGIFYIGRRVYLLRKMQ